MRPIAHPTARPTAAFEGPADGTEGFADARGQEEEIDQGALDVAKQRYLFQLNVDALYFL